MNYTKGEWEVARSLAGDNYGVFLKNSLEQIARITPHNGEQEANANLIASAPELYEALKNAVIAMGSMYRLQEYNDQEVKETLIPFNKTLAKAEGGK